MKPVDITTDDITRFESMDGSCYIRFYVAEHTQGSIIEIDDFVVFICQHDIGRNMIQGLFHPYSAVCRTGN